MKSLSDHQSQEAKPTDDRLMSLCYALLSLYYAFITLLCPATKSGESILLYRPKF